MARFVILAHDWPFLHWDFLVEVEADGYLRAWRLLVEPTVETDIPAEANGDHRLACLDYEGPVSGGRGSVSRWDAGDCSWLVNDPDRVVVQIAGAKLAGRTVIQQVGGTWVFLVNEERVAE